MAGWQGSQVKCKYVCSDLCLVLSVHTQANGREFKGAVASWLYMRIININMIYDILLNTSHYTHTLTRFQNVDFSVPIPISHSLDIISLRVYLYIHHTDRHTRPLFMSLSRLYMRVIEIIHQRGGDSLSLSMCVGTYEVVLG